MVDPEVMEVQHSFVRHDRETVACVANLARAHRANSDMHVGAIEILRFARYARLARPPFDPDLLHPNQDEDAYKNFILDYRCVPAPWMAR